MLPVKSQRYSLSNKRFHEDWISQSTGYPTAQRKLLSQGHGGTYVYASTKSAVYNNYNYFFKREN